MFFSIQHLRKDNPSIQRNDQICHNYGKKTPTESFQFLTNWNSLVHFRIKKPHNLGDLFWTKAEVGLLRSTCPRGFPQFHCSSANFEAYTARCELTPAPNCSLISCRSASNNAAWQKPMKAAHDDITALYTVNFRSFPPISAATESE